MGTRHVGTQLARRGPSGRRRRRRGGTDPTTDASEGRVKFLREVEIKHSRVAMLAAVGWVVGETVPNSVPSYVAFQESGVPFALLMTVARWQWLPVLVLWVTVLVLWVTVQGPLLHRRGRIVLVGECCRYGGRGWSEYGG